MKFTAWSYSRLHDYDVCPRKAKLKHIDKITEPPSKAMGRGSAIHKMAEDYVSGKLRELPKELSQFCKEFGRLRRLKAATEDKWAFDARWKPLDSFFHADTAVRLVVDALNVQVVAATKRGKGGGAHTHAEVIDYKTGQRYGHNEEQVRLYALGVFEKFPHVTTVDVQLWYLDIGELDTETFTREEHYATLREYWEKRPKKMLADTAFKPTPGAQCPRCYYCKAKHGDCEF